MDSGALLVAGFFGLLLLTALVALRTVSAGRIEVKLTDAAIAAIPILLWLLGSGQVTKLVVGAEGITVETTRMAILEAADRPIENQVAPLPVAPVTIAAKGSIFEIPALVASGIAALEFQLGEFATVIGAGGGSKPGVRPATDGWLPGWPPVGVTGIASPASR